MGPKLAASLIGNHKILFLGSAVKKQLPETSLVGRVAKKKPYILLLMSFAHHNLFLIYSKNWTELAEVAFLSIRLSSNSIKNM